jgi:hypothetical protein
MYNVLIYVHNYVLSAHTLLHRTVFITNTIIVRNVIILMRSLTANVSALDVMCTFCARI